MKEIQLTAVPRLSLSTLIGKVFYEVSIKECNGIMAATVIRDGVTIVDNRRCCAGVPIIPRGHLEDGNFFILTSDDELPYFNRFDGKDQLVYLSQDEIDEIANSFTPWPEAGSVPSTILAEFNAAEGELGGIALSRASQATYIDKSGALRTAGVDEPRFEKEGLLIEGQSKNLVVYSEGTTFFTANDSFQTLTNNVSGVLPMTGQRISFAVNNGETNANLIQTSLTLTGGQTYTYSTHFKVEVGDTTAPEYCIGIYAANGVNIGARAVIRKTGDGIYRVSVPFTVRGTDSQKVFIRFNRIMPASAVWTAVVGGVQVENLPFATSYIPTTGAAATRAADKTSVKDSSGYQPVSVYRKFLKSGGVTKELVKSGDLLPAGFYGHLQELKAWHRLLTDEEQAALGVRYV